MKRKTFIKHSFLAGLSVLSGLPKILMASDDAFPDVVVVQGANFRKMLELSMLSLGGWEGLDMQSQLVLLKPAVRYNETHHSGRNTNPDLLKSIIRRCYEFEAGGVYVTEHPKDNWKQTYKTSGIERTGKDSFAKVLPLRKGDFHIQDEGFHLHELTQRCDLLVNVGRFVISGKEIQGSVSNLQGLTLENLSWQDRDAEMFFSILNCIQPAINILEFDKNTLLLGKDPVLLDAYCCSIKGLQGAEYVRVADQLGYLSRPVEKISVEKIYI